MFIPDDLSPLPVLPVSGDTEKAPRSEVEGFVCDETIREILVGPMLVTPLVINRIPSSESFAGRHDLPPLDETPIVTLSSDEAYPDEAIVILSSEEAYTDEATVALSSDEAYTDEVSEAFEPRQAHPALSEPSHATDLLPRIRTRHGISRRRNSDRRWVLGMGLALLVIFGSGTLIELISNEALRRSRTSQSADQVETPVIALPKGDKRTNHQSLAASNPEYPAP